MSLKPHLLLFAVLALLCGQAASQTPLSSPAAKQPGVPASRPNILFILADDLGWRDLGCFGSTFHQTPNLDKLAERGVRFTQAYAANPLCSPTRSSVLTGLWPARIGITAPVCHLPQVMLEKRLAKGNPRQPVLIAESVTRLKTDYTTLPELLREAGYRTAHFGKWHLGPEPYSPLQHGFDVDWPHWPGPGPAGSYVAPWKYPANLNVQGNPGEHIEDTLSQHVADFIRANKDRPFFVNYWMFSVHAPYDAKDALVAKYRSLADPANPQRNPVYAAMVESLDNGIGRVMAALEEAGLMEKTVIVFFSDNGGVNWGGKDGKPGHQTRFEADMTSPPTSNLPLRGGKASLYEGGTREPCIVVWPGVTKPGTTNDTVIQSIDWMPTLLDMACVPLPGNAKPDGRSLVPVIQGGALDREAIFCHFPHDTPASGQHPGAYVRRGDWKLIRLFAQNANGSDQFELYNLRDDPGEAGNLAGAKPELVSELNALLNGFLMDTEAVIPQRNPLYQPAPGLSAAGMSWQASKDAQLATKDGSLVITSTGNDPWIARRDLPAGAPGPFTLTLRLASTGRGNGVVYFTDKAQGGFDKDHTAVFAMTHDGQPRVSTVKLPAEKLTAFRLDPGNAPGVIILHQLELRDASNRIVPLPTLRP